MEETEQNQQSNQADEALIREEEQAAAEQAGEIGGAGGADDVADEAERPLSEAGQGEAEGFEIAERDLIDKSENLQGPSPRNERFATEEERSDAEYGEADEAESSEIEGE
jgi:hypothetical protein